MDDQPVALHRKRKSTTMANNFSKFDHVTVADNIAQITPRTPVRLKKRVRFSDPGPLLVDETISTGITPFMQRTSFEVHSRSPSPDGSPQSAQRMRSRSLKRTPHIRRSLPAINPSSLWDDMTENRIELHFAPMRQILSARTKRRLQRRELSDEMNTIEGERRLATKQEHRIRELEAKLAVANSTDGPALAATGQLHTNGLQSEIDYLRQRLQETSATPAPMTPEEDFDDAATIPMPPSSPCPTIAFTDEPSSAPATPLSYKSEPRTSPINAVAVQTDVTTPYLLELEEQREAQRQHLISARMELEHLVPGETSLPLSPSSDCDASPMLSALLSHLRSAMSEVSRIEKLLRASEAQETKLRKEFNKTLKESESARSTTKMLENNLGKVNKVFLDMKAKATAKLEGASQHITELEADKKRSEHSITSLNRSLCQYQNDVKHLQELITQLEAENAAAIENLHKSHQKALSDLESHVDAETHGRRQAEAQVELIELRVAEIESLNRELKQAVNEKQQTLRSLESEWDQQRDQLEQEVYDIDVRLVDAQSKLEKLEREVGCLNVKLSDAEDRNSELEERVVLERRRSREAVGRVVGRVVECAGRAGEEVVRDLGPAQDGRVSFGLLTPQIDGGRFIDVVSSHIEGKVEQRRGKASKKRKHPDSGIGILEEDESEFPSSDL